jgi:hypothetical protein
MNIKALTIAAGIALTAGLAGTSASAATTPVKAPAIEKAGNTDNTYGVWVRRCIHYYRTYWNGYRYVRRYVGRRCFYKYYY